MVTNFNDNETVNNLCDTDSSMVQRRLNSLKRSIYWLEKSRNPKVFRSAP